MNRHSSSIRTAVLTILTVLFLFVSIFPAAADEDGYPERFDLRDQDLVSRVKDQSPWGSCWAYGVTAAAEISILAQLREMGEDYAEYYADPDNLDLSELQPAWFSYTKLPDYGQDDPHSQAGEGTEYPNALRLDNGGQTLMVANSYADGIGPIPEALAPYKAWKGEIDDDVRNSLNEKELTQDEENGVWYVPEGLRFTSAFELYESRDLPDFYIGDEFNEDAIYAIKDELMSNRGVAVSYCADTTRGDDEAEGYDYLNPETYAHYIPETMGSNHVVCIVGWDDNYSRFNFVEGNEPPEDGAWIVKNSWGSRDTVYDPVDEDEDDDEYMEDDDFWGVDGSGYFYLSYYDHSANDPQSFIFDILSEDSDTESLFRVIDQYDLFNGGYYSYAASDYGAEEISVANVFTADYDQYLRAVSLNTPEPNQEVSLSIYILDPEWESPVDGELVYSTDFIFPYAGWHKNDLDEGIELSAGDEFSLVMTTDVVAIEEMYDDPEDNSSEDDDFYEGTIIVNPHESFFLLNEENGWEDWIDISDTLSEEDEDSSVTMYYDNPGLKAYSEPIQNLTASLEGYISDQGWVEGSEMYFRVVVGNPYGSYLGPILIKSALSGLADDIYMEIVPEEGTAEANYIYYLTEDDVENGTVTEFVTVEALDAPHLVGQTLRLSVFD